MAAEHDLVAGGKVPEFRLPTDQGNEIGPSDFEGRYLVIYFYPKDDTTGCTREAQEFTTAIEEFRALGAEILGISRDSLTRHRNFRQKYGLEVMLASDEDGRVCEAFGVWKEKSMYGKKFMGIERSTFLVGPDGTVLSVWRKVRVPGHVEAVLEAVRTAAK